MRGVYARRADLQGADLQSANLQGADLIHAELQGVDVRWANLQGAVLVYTSLQGANLDVADLRGADLRSANLQGAGLGSADLQGADLDYADLQGAFLGYTKLQGVNLRDANLQGANLRSADLQGAVLLGANLRGADLRSAYLWRALLEEDEDLNDRWVLADLRWVGLEPMERAERLGGAMVPMRDAEAFVDRMLRQIEHEGTREFVRAKLRFHLIDDAAWREVVRAYLYSTYDAAWEDVPNFFPAWRSEPNVMFDPGDPLPRQLGWGLPKWPTEHTYDEDLASFLGELACEYASVHVAQGLARRATEVRDRDRLYAKLLAERLLGDDCAPTAGLPDDVRDDLRRLAGP